MFKKNKIRVVPVEKYTDFSERFEAIEKTRKKPRYATRKDVVTMGIVPTAAASGLLVWNHLNTGSSTIDNTTPVSFQPTSDAPVLSEPAPVAPSVEGVEGVVQTGFIADKSLEMLASILDPFIDIMVAISFPIASVIMVGACFFFMLGNSERAWGMIMNAGLGYVLIQLSPLFLDILRAVGDTV